MNALKDIAVDIVVLIVVIIYSLLQEQVLEIILWVYSGLLLLAKLLALFMPLLAKRAGKSNVPDLIFHIIYVLIIAALIYAGSYYLSATWLIIWVLSTYNSLQQKK